MAVELHLRVAPGEVESGQDLALDPLQVARDAHVAVSGQINGDDFARERVAAQSLDQARRGSDLLVVREGAMALEEPQGIRCR